MLPLCAVLAMVQQQYYYNPQMFRLSPSLHATGLLMAFALPLLAAYFLRGKGAVWNLGYALWVYVVALLDGRHLFQNVSLHALCALASVGLVVWGLQESRRERINLGVAGFAITIIVFYFSNVMDKLGRSAALVGFGVLFLLGGWQLEQLRRKLVARTRTAPTTTAPTTTGGAA